MKSRSNAWLSSGCLMVYACVGLATARAQADTLQDGALLNALRHGGYLLVMRHANSPPAAPDKASADLENVSLERQLDEAGRKDARAMGVAMRELQIPLGDVFSSPTYRALETVCLANFGRVQSVNELDVGAQGMTLVGVKDPRADWLRRAVSERPAPKTNTIIVTHFPNINAAFGESAAGIADGESLVFRPDGKGSATLVARLKIDEWSRLAAQK